MNYINEKNTLIVIALLKAHGIRRIVACPGGTNNRFVWSVQNDSYFTLYSAVDERHAAYLASGMAAESCEPVVVSCTGATASRNFYPALTEAYYRKLPILVITSSQPSCRIGNLIPQVTNRLSPPPDVVRYSYQCAVPTNSEQEWACQLGVNTALLALSHHGGGACSHKFGDDAV